MDKKYKIGELTMKNVDFGKIPTEKEAMVLLEEANKLNPGPWFEHSINVGKAAKAIAKSCENLDEEVALVCGLLHDIGRRYGVTSMRHSIDGYKFLKEKGYELPARICITHSFPYQDMRSVFGEWDCSNEEYEFVKDYVEKQEFHDYDKLIQFCDALALPDGCCLMEKRLIDVALRHGLNDYIIPKWEAIFSIKDHFENLMGKSVYSVLPGVVENTFKF